MILKLSEMSGKRGNLTNTFRKVLKTGVKFPTLVLIKMFQGLLCAIRGHFPGKFYAKRLEILLTVSFDRGHPVVLLQY